MKNHNFRELIAWKESISLCASVLEATKKLPDYEKFSLQSQMNRSVISIPSNIAEGTSRNSVKDLSKFLDYSLGSCYELETQFIITQKVYPDVITSDHLNQLYKIQNYIGAFKHKINSKNP
ncbi:MAG: four helix bundle protein [Crocinitomicaceae bacterium]